MVLFPVQFLIGVVTAALFYLVLSGFGLKVGRKATAYIFLFFTMPVMIAIGTGHGGASLIQTNSWWVISNIIDGRLGFFLYYLPFVAFSLLLFTPLYLISFRKINEKSNNFFSSNPIHSYRQNHPYKAVVLSISVTLLLILMSGIRFYQSSYLPKNYVTQQVDDVIIRIPNDYVRTSFGHGRSVGDGKARLRIDNFLPYALPSTTKNTQPIPIDSDHVSVEVKEYRAYIDPPGSPYDESYRLGMALNPITSNKKTHKIEVIPRVKQVEMHYGLTPYVNALHNHMDVYALPNEDVYILEGSEPPLFFVCRNWPKKRYCYTDRNMGPMVSARILFSYDNLRHWKRITTEVFYLLNEWNQSYNYPIKIDVLVKNTKTDG